MRLVFSLSVSLSLLFALAPKPVWADEPQVFKAAGLDEAYEKMSAFQQRSVELSKGREADGIEFGVMTINAGMLNAWFAKVPEYDRRSPVFPPQLIAEIKARNLDLISLQEEWYETDFTLLEAAVGALNKETGKNFQPLRIDPKVQTSTGMVLLINQSRMTEPRPQSKFEDFVKDGEPILSRLEAGGGFRKGLLYVVFTAKARNGQEVRFLMGNAHLSATLSANRTRAEQIAAIQAIVQRESREQKLDFYILGCDFNLSPEFALALPQEQQAWQENADVYVKAFNAFPFIDAFRVVNPLEKNVGWTWDKRTNALIRNGSPVIKSEPLQRPDPILVGTAGAWPSDDAVVVTESGLVFDGPDQPPVSDHYGVYAKVRFLKR